VVQRVSFVDRHGLWTAEQRAAARALTGPPAVDGIGPTDRWEAYWREVDDARRRNAPWAAALALP